MDVVRISETYTEIYMVTLYQIPKNEIISRFKIYKFHFLQLMNFRENKRRGYGYECNGVSWTKYVYDVDLKADIPGRMV
jgi:hypothetical protein